MKIKFKNLLRAPLANVYDYPVYSYVLHSLEFLPGDSVLDVGCGTGIIEYLARDYVKKIVGVDASEPAIQYLKKHCGGTNADFYSFDVQSSASETMRQSFDKIICIDVMEHVDSPARALSFICETLKETGRAIVTFPVNNFSHGTPIRPQDVERLVSGLPCSCQVIYLRERFSLIVFLYKKIRQLFPLREAAPFDQSLSFELLDKKQKNFFYAVAYNFMRFVITAAALCIMGSYFQETAQESQRCVLIVVRNKRPS